MKPPRRMMSFLVMVFLGLAAWAGLLIAGPGKMIAQVPKATRPLEAERIAVIQKVTPAVVAVCFYGGEACGSGVLIDATGYALTNYHVVEPTGPILQCGLPDGQLYDAVVVGVDRVGDVALIRLFPKQPGQPFPYVPLGDSDRVRAGDSALALGNPFGLSLDFTPTVTYGLVSGVNRYQPPESGGMLEYTDCIQIETSINPGNSGGPLFNLQGELIGINGRGSFEKRGRVNSGVGYAISINQIKNFLGHLRAGLDVDHATLGAEITTQDEDGDLSRLLIRQIQLESDAALQGLLPGDQLQMFAGRPLTSTNQYKNILGIFPRGWRVPIRYRRAERSEDVLVRLMGTQNRPLGTTVESKPAPKPSRPPGAGRKSPPGYDQSPARAYYVQKPGYANYFFNQQRLQDCLAAQKPLGEIASLSGPWSALGQIQLVDRRGEIRLDWREGGDGLTTVTLTRNGIVDAVTPLKADLPLGELLLPQGSQGLLAALYQYRRFWIRGPAGFEGGFDHGGEEPIYPPRAEGAEPMDWQSRRQDCEVLRTKHAGFESKWDFDF